MGLDALEFARLHRRAMTSLLMIDAFCMLSMIGFWWVVGLADPGLLIALSLVRAVVWIGYVVRFTAPLRAAARGSGSIGDADLLAADEALQELARRSMFVYAITWVVCELSWVAALAAGVPVEIAHGGTEVFAGLMFASTAPALGTVHRLFVEGAFLGLHTQVSEELARRRLHPERPDAKLVQPLVVTASVMLFGIVVLLGAVGMMLNAASARELEQARLRGVAELGAVDLLAGAKAVAGGEIVEADRLPAEIEAELGRVGLDASGAAPREVVTVMIPGREQAAAAASLGDGRWVVVSAPVETSLAQLGGLLVILALSSLPVFLFGFSAYARRITAPLERFGDATAQFIERGELGALERIVPLRGDELGRLATNFNRMLDILDELTAAATAVSSGDLTVELGHPGGLHDAFRGMLVQLNEIVGRLRETSLELASAAAEIIALTQDQSQAAQTQSASVAQANELVASLAASAQHIAVSARGVVEDTERAAATTDATADKIAELRDHAARVGELLELIREVADRSDLLALNGSLEATRAGEAGRGFALVATEMRRLAERVTGTVASVRERVADIEASGAGTVLATEHSRELVSRAAEAARAISTITADQSTDTEQAAMAMRSVAEVVVRTNEAVSQTGAAAEGLRAHAIELERLMATFAVRELA